MREQNDGIVVLDGTLQRLPILKAWTNSSAVFWVRPSYPTTAMYFMVGNAKADGWAAEVAMTLHPVRGLWRAYIPGINFTERCETRYKIVTIDANDARHVEGEGILRVYSGHIVDVSDSTKKCYVAWPGGAVREVEVGYDSAGVPVFEISKAAEGAEADERPLYAYNKATGFFYLVTPFVDSAGEPMLSVADEPSEEGGDMTYVRDASGFYHRIDCAEDSAGAMMLQTGGKII